MMDEPAQGRDPAAGPESKLPMAAAIIFVVILNLLLPTTYRITEVVYWLFPAIVLVLLLVLLTGDMGHTGRVRRGSRVVSGLLVGAITLIALGSALRVLIVVLSDPDAIVSTELLRVAVVLWVTVNISFALWYSYFDCGGPTARAQGGPDQRPAFIFPEYAIEGWGLDRWRPEFPDYLLMSFFAAMALGPSDVSVVRRWAKFSVLTQSLFSLCMLYIVLSQAISTL